MIKIIINILLLLSINVSADLVDDGLAEYQKGNLMQASKLYKEACDSGIIHGCVKLGILYFTGDGVKQNYKKAKKLFVKACKKRNAVACYHLGTIYKRGVDGIERNTKKARMFYAFSCSLGNMQSCEQHELIREKPEIIGTGKNAINSGYTFTRPEIYGG